MFFLVSFWGCVVLLKIVGGIEDFFLLIHLNKDNNNEVIILK